MSLGLEMHELSSYNIFKGVEVRKNVRLLFLKTKTQHET